LLFVRGASFLFDFLALSGFLWDDFAAAPPDVRYGCAIPGKEQGFRGYAPTVGA